LERELSELRREPPPRPPSPFLVASGESNESNVLRKYFFEISALWLKNEAIRLLISSSARLASRLWNSSFFAMT